MKRTLIVLFILLLAFKGFAQLSDIYRPVGTTINAFNFECGNYSQTQCPFINPPSDNINLSETFDLFLTSNESQNSRAFGIDASVEGHYLFGKAKVDVHKAVQQNDKSSITVICFSANLDYGTSSQENTDMTSAARAMIQSNPTDFINKYGDYYISQEKIVKKLFIYLDVECTNYDEMKTLSGGCSGGVDMGVWSAAISSSARQVVNTAYRSKRCHFVFNSLGLFDNSILASLPSLVDNDQNQQKSNFDLFTSLQKHLIELLKEDQNTLHRFHLDPVYSDFTSLGLDRSNYIFFKRRVEKLEAINNVYSKLEQIQYTIDQYLKNDMWRPFISDKVGSQLRNIQAVCNNLKDSTLQLKNDCEKQDCLKISSCCNLPVSLSQEIDNLTSQLNQALGVYIYGNPCGRRSFGINKMEEIIPLVDTKKKWIINYRNSDPPSLNPIDYKVLDRNTTPVTFILNSIIYIQGYNPSVNSFNLVGKVYDFTTQQEISSHPIGQGLKYMSTSNSSIKVSGAFTIDYDPNIIYSSDDIGFVLVVEENTPSTNINNFLLVGYNGLNGQPDPLIQGLLCTLAYIPH